ncbi:hypothetical protein V1511DRAFT_46550 [Dipodascopsis uninucleata]
MMSGRLSAMKKKELVELAEQLGVDTDGYKSDIESRISEYLAENAGALSNDARYASFYSQIIASPGPVGSVGARRRSVRTPMPVEKKTRRRSVAARLESPVSAEDDVSSESSGDSEVGGDGSLIGSLLPSAVSSQLMNVSDSVTRTTDSIGQGFKKSTSGVVKVLHKMRAKLSTASTVNHITALYEVLCIIHHLMPCTKRVKTLTLPFLNTVKFRAFFVPDTRLVCKYDAFWQPILFWFAYMIVLPLIASYFVNFTIVKSSSARARYKFDPVTFNVVKLLTTYFLYSNYGKVTESVITGSTVVTASKFVDSCIPFAKSQPVVKNILENAPYVGSIIGALISLYVAVLL